MSLNNILRIIFMKYRLARHNTDFSELSGEIGANLKHQERIDVQVTSIIAEIDLVNTNIARKNNMLDKIRLKTLNLSEESPAKKSKISETKFKGMVLLY